MIVFIIISACLIASVEIYTLISDYRKYGGVSPWTIILLLMALIILALGIQKTFIMGESPSGSFSNNSVVINSDF